MPDVIRSCVLAKGGDVLSRLKSFNRVCCPKAVMSCHAQCSLTVEASQGRLFHATPNVVQLCLRSKGYNGMAFPTSFDSVCCQKAMIACHARLCFTVCCVQGQ